MRKSFCLVIGVAAAALADPAVYMSTVGTRAFGMAGTFTSCADDFSALFWNPAGLAFVQTREVHCAVGLDRQNARTGSGGRTTPAFHQRIRLNSAGLMRSVPTVRGGFGFALGFSSPWLLDDLISFEGGDVYKDTDDLAGDFDTLRAGDTLIRDKNSYASTGRCTLWSAAVGWQIAPGLGFGFSIGFLSGSQDMKITVISHTLRTYFENIDIRHEREYLGYDARIGLLYVPARAFSVGFRLDLPRRAKVAENSGSVDYLIMADTAATAFGVLQSGLSGTLGAALRLPYLTAAGDMRFRPPMGAAPAGSDLARWKVGAGIGAEVPLRLCAGIVRCGYSWNELGLSSMQIKWDDEGVGQAEPLTVRRNQHLFTAGYSQFLGSVFILELAYGCCFWQCTSRDPWWENERAERHVLQRGMLSLSIRY